MFAERRATFHARKVAHETLYTKALRRGVAQGNKHVVEDILTKDALKREEV